MDEYKGIEEGQNYKTLTLDVDYYQSFLDDADIPDDKKQELIETLWNIVVQFVDLGFGIHPLQQADNSTADQLHPTITKMIEEAVNEEFNNLKETNTERSKT